MPAPKSTGREYFNLTWLKNYLHPSQTREYVQATLSELTARTITDSIKTNFSSGEIYICGGGAHNQFLMQRIVENAHGFSVNSTATLGVDPNWVEAMAFAWLAKQTLGKHTSNIISVTGATHACVLGRVYYT